MEEIIEAVCFKEETITIQMRKLGVVTPDLYELVQQERTAHVVYAYGKSTGLAYYTYIDSDGETVYSLTHVPSGCSVLGSEYDMGSKESMLHWIELCLSFADWTGERPVITSLKNALKYAAIGAREEA